MALFSAFEISASILAFSSLIYFSFLAAYSIMSLSSRCFLRSFTVNKSDSF